MDPNSNPVSSRPAGEPRRPARSQLFALRLWQAKLGNGQSEWRGQLQHVVGGQIRYFRDWPTLIRQLGELLSETDAMPLNGKDEEP
jgi:hypothetical protein